jgi:hypothetical protein
MEAPGVRVMPREWMSAPLPNDRTPVAPRAVLVPRGAIVRM